MKAIWTKYIGPSNVRGSRVRAVAERRLGPNMPEIGITIGWDDAKNSDENHDAAALALCAKMGWPGDLMRGARPDGCGNVYTFICELRRVPNPVPSYAEQERRRKDLAGG